ncbi:tyrosine-type recombinase/integrase [Nocardia cyriacigeorgica]|uniref:tyrosine-type recombinase/integrase n=1 Tax=Nocardia cyriacigeorgica TaxID=135487 RepID=UPI0018951925|nr:tyrosine-type recombinase/integrase [Nocardia cyriacigeorgica]MBF6102380.1 tyrosine-type recombinase/integrase [Nocardia cyriacigeorgica]
MSDTTIQTTGYTTRSRRRPAPRRFTDTPFPGLEIQPAPAPLPTVPPGRFGDLSRASIEEIVVAASRFHAEDGANSVKRRQGVRAALAFLADQPGDTWQERWEAAGLNERDRPFGHQVEPVVKHRRQLTAGGLRELFCLRVIRPSVAAFRSNRLANYSPRFRLAQRDPGLDRYFAMVEGRADIPRAHRTQALFDVCCALTTQGIAFADLTPSAFLHYSAECRRYGDATGAFANHTKHTGALAWQLLRELGHFPASTAPTIRSLIYKGQKTIEEMVDGYGISDREVRDLLIAYLTRRQADSDYGSIASLARCLVKHFWASIETINPAQTGLMIDQATYGRWREGLNWIVVKGEVKQRKDPHAILLHVRALYADIHSWAVEDPATWARWAAPCPIPYGELRGYGKRRRRVKERIDDRIRRRQPLLPVLVEYVETEYEQARALVEAGNAVAAGDVFTHNGVDYERVVSAHDLASPEHIAVRVRDLATGAVTNASIGEDYAFWRWTVVEVLRLSGIRIEELCELTHLSIRQYRRQNGEVIALLVVAPSKADRERVIPMSAELFHVIAQVVRRHTGDGRTIRLLARYDTIEKLWSEPMPFLFQRQHGGSHQVISRQTILEWLRDACQEIGRTNSAFADLHFTPHDFRRLLATELANSGLPIHIGAALLGHLHLDTFRGYVAVFDEDLVRHYQAHLERRRKLRPTEEYRDVTDAEWHEFQEHFDRRKVELGGCARPYGVGCQHEHACIRCPMLSINPKMLARLDEIETDLLDRRARAEREQWHGEIEGIDMTLAFLRQKRTETERLVRIAPTGPTMLTLDPPPPRQGR